MTSDRLLLSVSLVGAVAVGSTWCGGSSSAIMPSGLFDAAVGPADAGNDGALASSDSSADATDAESDATYSGVVLATGTPGAFAVFADFAQGSGFGIAQCEADAGSCCCFQGAFLPRFLTPSAGTVTVTDDAGAIATLSPAAVFVAEGGATSTSFQGTWDLGQPWFDFPSTYNMPNTIEGIAGVWSAGDALQVSATGGEIEPFSGTLQTGALLAGVTPAIGATTMVVDRSVDFTVAWTPEGRAGESVILMLQQIMSGGALTCYCKVPDSTGSVTMSASMLGAFGTQQVSNSVRLERLIESSAQCDNASIDLVGEVSAAAYVAFQ